MLRLDMPTEKEVTVMVTVVMPTAVTTAMEPTMMVWQVSRRMEP
jgi:hypothetical protein